MVYPLSPWPRAPKCRTGRALARATGMIKLPSPAPPRCTPCLLLPACRLLSYTHQSTRPSLSISHGLFASPCVYRSSLRPPSSRGFSTFSGSLNSGPAFSARTLWSLFVSGRISGNIPSAARARRLDIRTPIGPVCQLSAQPAAYIDPRLERAHAYSSPPPGGPH